MARDGAIEAKGSSQHESELNGFGGGSLQDLLSAMQAVDRGDFSVRLPGHWTGLGGKLADTFNSIVSANARMATELERVGVCGQFTWS